MTGKARLHEPKSGSQSREGDPSLEGSRRSGYDDVLCRGQTDGEVEE
jgi:hypothetical protein